MEKLILQKIKHKDFFSYPIFIISYNRVDELKCMVEHLLRDGYNNLVILDNASTNKNVQDYLYSLNNPCVMVKNLKKNYGHKVLWECHEFDDVIENQYYVLTDPDVFPIEECPNNYVEVFWEVLQDFPQKTKVGFSLKIDDLPEEYPFKYDIIRFESFYWENKLPYHFPIYDAEIDTTFALYRPGKIDKRKFGEGIRTGGIYIARHQGWYITPTSMKNEYYAQKNIFSTSMNRNAMSVFQMVVIYNLLKRQNEDIYRIAHRILPVDKIKNNYTLLGIFRTFLYLIRKKIC